MSLAKVESSRKKQEEGGRKTKLTGGERGEVEVEEEEGREKDK